MCIPCPLTWRYYRRNWRTFLLILLVDFFFFFFFSFSWTLNWIKILDLNHYRPDNLLYYDLFWLNIVFRLTRIHCFPFSFCFSSIYINPYETCSSTLLLRPIDRRVYHGRTMENNFDISWIEWEFEWTREKIKQFEFVDYLAFSEFSSHDSVTTAGSAPTASSATSVFLPLRTSTTMGNMTDIANTSEFQGFLDDFNCQQSSNMSRW